MTESIRFRREKYLHQLNGLLGSGTSAMVTGTRGCGKTTVLRTFAEEHGNTVIMEAERGMDASELEEAVEAVAGRPAVLIGVTGIPGWEDVVARYRREGTVFFVECGDSGECRNILSSGTGMAELRVRPMSFAECVDAREETDRRALVYDYLHFGGMPAVVSALNESHTDARKMLPELAESLVREAASAARIDDTAGMTDVYAEILGDSSLRMSPKEVSGRLVSSGKDINRYLARKYAAALRRFYLFDVPDVKVIGDADPGSRYEWYLAPDLGIREAMAGYSEKDVMRNAVFKEIVFRDPSAALCRMNREEVGFVFGRDGHSEYVQTASGPDPEASRDVYGMFSRIGDGSTRTVVMESTYPDIDTGEIRTVRLRNWLYEGISDEASVNKHSGTYR